MVAVLIPRRPPRVYRVVATARSAAQSASPTTEPAARPGASLNIAVLAASNAATSVVPAMDPAINAASAGFVDPRTIDVIDALYERAVANGARVLQEPKDFEYGERQCTIADPYGHQWSLSQTLKDVAPEEWGGTSKA